MKINSKLIPDKYRGDLVADIHESLDKYLLKRINDITIPIKYYKKLMWFFIGIGFISNVVWIIIFLIKFKLK